MRLSVRDLSFSYGPRPVIAHLDHAFPIGAITAITGPSGQGKSTLLYLLGLMLTPTSGEVLLDEIPMAAKSDAERSAARGEFISIVFQDALLDPARTTVRNVMEGAVYSASSIGNAQRALELLDRFGVGHRARHRPGEVSGGQAQRIALCRALIKKPAVVLADEPTGNLDSESAEIVWDALVQAARDEGRTVIVATHDQSLVAASDERLEL